jgi:hypothetical protein
MLDSSSCTLLGAYFIWFALICTIYFHCGKPASVPRIGRFVQVLVHREGVSSWHGRWEAIHMDLMSLNDGSFPRFSGIFSFDFNGILLMVNVNSWYCGIIFYLNGFWWWLMGISPDVIVSVHGILLYYQAERIYQEQLKWLKCIKQGQFTTILLGNC